MKKEIHIINPFHNACGGSEWRAISLYNILKPYANVSLWSFPGVSSFFLNDYPIQMIDVATSSFPVSGTFVIVGPYFDIESWIHLSKPERCIYLYNTPSPNLFAMRMRYIEENLGITPDVVYVSEKYAREGKYPGTIEISPIDTDRFRPLDLPKASSNQKFVVGRLSRDVPEKHHPDDPNFYRNLLDTGFHIRIMGGDCLKNLFPGEKFISIEFLPESSEAAELFLNKLDCFFYRTSDDWLEPYGRVIFEAMSCGLPVVCHTNGGYADYITHGKDGFLFDKEEQALSLINALREDADLRKFICGNARKTAVSMYSDTFTNNIVSFYLG